MTISSLFDTALNIFSHLTESSWHAGMVILAVLAIRTALGKRLAGRWLCGLWLIAMLRLAMPWVPETHWNPLPREADIQSILAMQDSRITVSPTPVQGEAISPDMRLNEIQANGETASAIPHASPQSQTVADSAWTWQHIICLIWLAGAIILGGFICINVALLRRNVICERLLTDTSVLNLLEDCKRQMGITVPIGVVITDKIGSPALFGFVRPRLLIPRGVLESLQREELRHVFLHELAHIKRYDVLVGWAMCVLQVLHWFNPLVWLAQSRMRADRELACDALVLRSLGSEEPRAYGNTIVNLLERFSQPRYLPALTGILEDKSQLRRRITMIAKFRPQSRLAAALALALSATVALLALTTAPGMAASEADKASASTAAPDITKPKTFAPNKVYTIMPGKGLDIIQVGATADQIKAVFGTPETTDGDGRRIVYHEKASIDFWLDRGGKVSEIRFNRGFRGQTDNGIRIGSKLDMVLSKSGGVKKTVNASRHETHGCKMGMDRVLYNQKEGREVIAYKFVDQGRGVLYWFDADKTLTQIVVFASKQTAQISPSELLEGSKIDERGHIVDRIDWPFVNDPAAIGKWESVDFVPSMDLFKPGKQSWKGNLFLKEMDFKAGGKLGQRGEGTWTKGLVLNKQDKTASKYEIKDMQDDKYMFFEWKSGDYTIRHRRPFYYVLRKLPAGDATKSNPVANIAAIESAQAWLGFVDDGNYAKSWEEAAATFKSAVNQEDLGKSLRSVRTPLGKVISRKVKMRQYTKSLPGAPDGEYVVIQFETKFENKADAIETVTPMLDKDGKWRVSGYYIK